MFKVLVTGANGQLGSELKLIAPKHANHFSFQFVHREDLDLLDRNLVEDYIFRNKCNGIINAAAYTAVDLAEKEIEKANLGNIEIPKILSIVASKHNIRLVHFSTDFVFDGKNSVPYKEDDITNPISVYGSSKELGERAVLGNNPNAVIVRTSWVYSKFGNNFVKTMRRLGKERPELKVIYDQIGSPTWARDLAEVSLKILNSDLKGIYNFSNEGVASWYDFAKTILMLSGLNTKIYPIETKDYPTPATRPHYSLLNKAKIKSALNLNIPHWTDSLKDCLSEMESETSN
ncbi:MAG: dTDP-4-dehydrorhamnose reductase [Leptospira sp.]|nr:dTDP-4-dehydrorhamnose reductase [Leptospira sp.]